MQTKDYHQTHIHGRLQPSTLGRHHRVGQCPKLLEHVIEIV